MSKERQLIDMFDLRPSTAEAIMEIIDALKYEYERGWADAIEWNAKHDLELERMRQAGKQIND